MFASNIEFIVIIIRDTEEPTCSSAGLGRLQACESHLGQSSLGCNIQSQPQNGHLAGKATCKIAAVKVTIVYYASMNLTTKVLYELFYKVKLQFDI